MLRLKVLKPVSYISYSSFQLYEQCPYKYYLSKLSGIPTTPKPSNYAAGVGVFFDAMIKAHIAKTLKLDEQIFSEENLLKGFESENHSEAYRQAREVAWYYIKSGFCDRLLNIAKGRNPTETIHINQEILGKWGHVPILGIPDIIVNGVPFDWKTRGFSKPTVATEGYTYSCDANGKNPGRSSRQGFYLEEDNAEWATQFVFYNLLTNKYIGHRAYIHEIVNTHNGVFFYEHDRKISDKFVGELSVKLSNMWSKLAPDEQFEITLPSPEPRRHKCEKWGQLCEWASRCPNFQKTLDDKALFMGYIQ